MFEWCSLLCAVRMGTVLMGASPSGRLHVFFSVNKLSSLQQWWCTRRWWRYRVSGVDRRKWWCTRRRWRYRVSGVDRCKWWCTRRWWRYHVSGVDKRKCVRDVCSCLCLMCELSRIPSCVTDVAKLLPCLAAAAGHKNYPHHVYFLQSVCKQVVLLLLILL